jgi:hypothetical protein
MAIGERNYDILAWKFAFRFDCGDIRLLAGVTLLGYYCAIALPVMS